MAPCFWQIDPISKVTVRPDLPFCRRKMINHDKSKWLGQLIMCFCWFVFPNFVVNASIYIIIYIYYYSICSMHGIFTNICCKKHPNVGKYTSTSTMEHLDVATIVFTSDVHLLSGHHDLPCVQGRTDADQTALVWPRDFSTIWSKTRCSCGSPKINPTFMVIIGLSCHAISTDLYLNKCHICRFVAWKIHRTQSKQHISTTAVPAVRFWIAWRSRLRRKNPSYFRTSARNESANVFQPCPVPCFSVFVCPGYWCGNSDHSNNLNKLGVSWVIGVPL